MILIKKEYHRVVKSFNYEIPDNDIVAKFGSIERFREIASHLSSEDSWMLPEGDDPTEAETDGFYEFMDNYDFEQDEDDWVTDRKGGYDVVYEVDYGVDL